MIINADLKPENLLFRTVEEDADIMIADFGLSRVMDGEKFNMLTEICGTPGVSFDLFYQLVFVIEREPTTFGINSTWLPRSSKRVRAHLCFLHTTPFSLVASFFIS